MIEVGKPVVDPWSKVMCGTWHSDSCNPAAGLSLWLSFVPGAVGPEKGPTLGRRFFAAGQASGPADTAPRGSTGDARQESGDPSCKPLTR